MEHRGGQSHGTVVGTLGLTVAQSHESVDSGRLRLEVVVGDRKEGSDHVDVDEHTVVLEGGGDVVLTDLLGLVEVVPVLLLVELVGNGALLSHIRSDVEGASSSSVLGKTHSLVVEIEVSSDGDGSVGIDDDHVLIGAEFETHDEGVDVDGVVVGSASSFEPVSQSDEGVDLGGLSILGPGGDHQEGSNNVPIDGKVEVGELGINAGLIDGVGVPQVVPVFGLEQLINFRPDIEQSDCGLSFGHGHGGGVEVGTFGLAGSQGQAQGEQQSDVQLVHIQYIEPFQPLNIYRANSLQQNLGPTTSNQDSFPAEPISPRYNLTTLRLTPFHHSSIMPFVIFHLPFSHQNQFFFELLSRPFPLCQFYPWLENPTIADQLSHQPIQSYFVDV